MDKKTLNGHSFRVETFSPRSATKAVFAMRGKSALYSDSERERECKALKARLSAAKKMKGTHNASRNPNWIDG